MISFLERRILCLIRRQLSYSVRGRLHCAARLAEDLGLDHLELVRLLTSLERRYGIRISDETLARLRTVADVAACVRGHRSARRSPGYDLVYYFTPNQNP